MTHRLFYHFLAADGSRHAITLSLHDLGKEEVNRLETMSVGKLQQFLSEIVVGDSELQHVTGPVEDNE